MAVTLKINGCTQALDVNPDKPLLWVLREDLGLTGTKYGCGIGQCRSCTVLRDGSAIQSCLYKLSACEGTEVKTIEGLDDDLGRTIQDAWVAEASSQCGYCQPGQVCSAYALLSKNASPTDDDIDSGMKNYCRCGTYPRIRRAIHRAADATKGSK
jgi:isoquinoline 1-oxidoreductase subunit alpha